MKITKSELKEMIHEALREELSRAKRPLKEAAPTTASEIINRYNDNVADHIIELEHEKAFNDAEWFEYEWYVLENVKVDPDYFVLVMDRPVESIQDAEAIISYAFSPANIVNIEEAMSEGGVVQDSTSNELYIERWVVSQDNVVTEAAEFTTKAEMDFKKEFISAILKDHPERKAACEILYKFDFRSNGDHFSIDVQNGIIMLPQSVIKNKDIRYKWLVSTLFREFTKLASSMQKITKLRDCLEDAYLDLK